MKWAGGGGRVVEGIGLGEGMDRRELREEIFDMLWRRLRSGCMNGGKMNSLVSAGGASMPQTVRAGGHRFSEVEGEKGAVVLVVAEDDVQVDSRGAVLEPVRGEGLGQEARGEEGRVGRVGAEHGCGLAQLPASLMYLARPVWPPATPDLDCRDPISPFSMLSIC